MSRRVVTMITGAVLLVVLGVLGARLPVPYAALGPGPTLDTLSADPSGKQIIQVTGHSLRHTTGHLNLTTVSVQDQLDLLTALRGWLDPSVAVVPREEVYPPGQSVQQTDQQNTQDFLASQDAARIAALAELGYPVDVVVSSVAASSPSRGLLAAHDVIDSVGGVQVHTFDQLTAVSTVTVGYTRSGRPAAVRIPPMPASGRSGAALGLTVTMDSSAPFTVNIGVDESIGGPSAGLMFALGILDKVGPADLTGGRFIAGTGTIDITGAVGPIGGIQLKMIGARDKGATVFLVPADNCAEALQRPPAGLQLIKVASLHSAVTALEALQTGQPAPSC